MVTKKKVKKRQVKGKPKSKKKATKKAATKKAPSKGKKKKATKKKVLKKKTSKKKLSKKKASKKKASTAKALKKKASRKATKKATAKKGVARAKEKALSSEKTKSFRDMKKAPIIIDYDLDSKVQRQKDVAWRMIDGEAVIITPSDSTMHTLNDVGTRIWELITGNRTLREVAGVLCTEFEVEKDRAEKDTLWFVECLAKKGLVEGSV